jgi:catalase
VHRGFESFGAEGRTEPKLRARSESFADHYSQARLFYCSQTPTEQAHMAMALVFELSKVVAAHVRTAMVAHLRNISEELAARVADGLGLKPLPEPAFAARAPFDMPPSDALSIHKKAQSTLQGRSVGILIAEGSDRGVVDKLQKRCESEGAHCKRIASRLEGFSWADGTPAMADAQLAGTPSVLFDAVALALSTEQATALTADAAAVDFVRDAYGHLKAIGTTDGAAPLLDAARVKPDAGVVALEDGARFVGAAMTRQWDREGLVRPLPRTMKHQAR